jgi:hypothetical protein
LKKQGFALALTLWIIAMMSLVSVLYLSYGKKVVNKSRQLNQKLHLTFKAESMVELLKFYGSTGVFESTYMQNKFVQEYFSLFPKKMLIDSTKMVWDNTTIVLQDTAGLIDLSDTIAIANYIKFETQELKDKKDIIEDSISDWLDTDQFSKLNGAEDSFYQKYKYQSRDSAYFVAPEELFLLRGIEDLNSSVKDKILSVLVMSDYKKQNIATLDNVLLKRIFNISKSDLIQLKKLKEANDLNRFMLFFSTIYKENYDFESVGARASKILKITIICSNKNIKKEIKFLIDFRESKDKIFKILNYQD